MGKKKQSSQQDFVFVYRAIFGQEKKNAPKVRWKDPDRW
jgi:hypothetical protein